jgi:hypothetical protein
MSHSIRTAHSMVFALSLMGAFGACCGVAAADDTPQPKTTATRPAREQTEQSSMPNAAPAATRTQTTGATNQDAPTAKMNEEAKKKLETEGK